MSPRFQLLYVGRRIGRLFSGGLAAMSESNTGIESSMQENRVFPPPAGFAEKAWISSHVQYDRMYRQSIDEPEAFWGEAAAELHWFKKWDRVLDWKPPYAKWLVG